MSEPTDEDYKLAARHSDAERQVTSILYRMRLLRLEYQQQLAPLEQQLQAARLTLASLEPQYQALLDRLEEEEQEEIETCSAFL